MNKKLFTVILLIVLLITMTGIVTAASFTSGVQLNKVEAKPGEEVVVTLSIANIDKGDKDGINAIKGTISFDANVLIYSSNLVADGWQMQGFNEANATFAITRNAYTVDNQAFMTITFKVKENISSTSTDIKLTGVEASFGQESDITAAQTITTPDASTTLKITSSSGVEPQNPITNNNVVAPSNTQTNNQLPSITSNVLNSNQSDKVLPQTGISDVVLVVIAVLGVVAVVSYIRYKKYINI